MIKIDKIEEKIDLYLVSSRIRNEGIKPKKSHFNKIFFIFNRIF